MIADKYKSELLNSLYRAHIELERAKFIYRLNFESDDAPSIGPCLDTSSSMLRIGFASAYKLCVSHGLEKEADATMTSSELIDWFGGKGCLPKKN